MYSNHYTDMNRLPTAKLNQNEAIKMTIKIYIADLNAHYNGIRHAVWIDATAKIESIKGQIKQMQSNSPIIHNSNELIILGSKGFGDYPVNPFDELDELIEVANFIKKHGALGRKVLNRFLGDLAQAKHAIEIEWYGVYNSLADYASQTLDATHETIRTAINFEALALLLPVYSVQVEHNEVHIFKASAE